MSIDQMWDRLTAHQPYADARGYGEAWAHMCRERTPEAAMVTAKVLEDAVEAIASDDEEIWAAWTAARRVAEWPVLAVDWIERAEGKT